MHVFSLVNNHLYPPVCPWVVGLDGTGRAAAAPASNSKQDLVGYPRPGTLWGLHYAVQLSDGLHVHQHLQGVYDDRSTNFVALHVRVVLDLFQQTRMQDKETTEIVVSCSIIVLLHSMYSKKSMDLWQYLVKNNVTTLEHLPFFPNFLSANLLLPRLKTTLKVEQLACTTQNLTNIS